MTLSSARWLGTQSHKTAQAFCHRQNTARRSHPRRASSSKVDLRFSISASTRVALQAPTLANQRGIVKSFQKNISGSCNPLQAKDVWAGYENLTIRHPHLMLLPPGLAPLRVPA